MRLQSVFALVAMLCLVCLAGTAQAVTITFDDIPNTANAIQTSVSSTGYNFNGLHFHIIDSPDARVVRDTSTSYLAAEKANDLGRPVTMTQAAGGTFTLNQVDVAELWLPGQPLNDFFSVFISANVFGGGTLTRTVTLDGIRDGAGGVPDFQLVTFVGWTNLVDVTFTGINAAGAFGDYSIDNIGVDGAAVPEPTTLALLSGGILGMARARRRARSGSTPGSPIR